MDTPKTRSPKILMGTVAGLSTIAIGLSIAALVQKDSAGSLAIGCVDTQSVVEAQKFLWLKELKAANHSTEALSRFTRETQAFPERLQKALQGLAREHKQQTLLECRVLALHAPDADLTPELFSRLGIDAQAAVASMQALRADTFGKALSRKDVRKAP